MTVTTAQKTAQKDMLKGLKFSADAAQAIMDQGFETLDDLLQLKDDDDLKEAVKILTAPEKYKEMLSAPAVTSMSLQQRKETAPVFLSTATRANEHVYDEIV